MRARRTDAFSWLARQVAALRGELCRVAAVLDTDGSAHVGLGAKVARARPLPGDALPAPMRLFSAEIGLYASCPWRLESGAGVVCSGHDAGFPGERAQRGLARLAGRSVVRARLERPAGDLRLELSDGLVLRLFCDRTDPQAIHANWSLLAPGGGWCVRGGGRVEFTPSEETRAILKVVRPGKAR